MKTLFLPLGLLAIAGADLSAAALGSAFTYQGRLSDRGIYPTGRYELQLSLWDDPVAGTRIGTTNIFSPVGVTNGLFTVTPDFGAGAFNGAGRWLSIAVRSNGVVTSPTTLAPRVTVAPAPHALFAVNAASAATAATAATATTATTATTANGVAPNAVGNAGLAAGSVTAAKIANGEVVKSLNNLRDSVTLAPGANITITPAGNTLTVAGSPDWKLGGNAGNGPANFLGTADNQPVRIKVNNTTALRVEPTAGTPNLVAGHEANAAAGVGSTVAGGGLPGFPNTVTDSYGTIGGGSGNLAGGSAVVAGGSENRAYYYGASIVGGAQNLAAGNYSFIGSGVRNTNQSLGGVIGGGYSNRVENVYAMIGGGFDNRSTNTATAVGGGQRNRAGGAHATVAGGGWNTASGVSSIVGGGGGNTFGGPWPNTASGDWSAILGGWNGTASGYSSAVGGGGNNTASGRYGVVPGGSFNEAAGSFSLAAGRNAKARHDGSFVWSDAQGGEFASTAANEFSVRAEGGVRLEAPSTRVTGGLSYDGQLNKLDVADNFQATIRAADLFLGFSGRRGTPGRALVDFGTELYVNFGADWGTTVLGSRARVEGAYLSVTGAGGEQAYLGGDGFSGDVEVGSQNPAVNAVVLWNTGYGDTMDLIARHVVVNGDVQVSGVPKAPGAGVNTPTFTFLAKKTNTIAGFDHVVLIDNPLINDNPNAFLFVQHNYNGDFRLAPKAVGVYLYSLPGGARRWGIYHEDLSVMPAGSAFNVLIVKP